MSSRTGPGRPVEATWKASWTYSGIWRGVGDLEGVLDEGQRGAEDVGLLEAVGADQLGADLAGDEDGRDRVHHRVGDRGDQVGRAGPGGGEGDPDPAGGLGVALGGVAAALLVADLDVAEVGVDERVVGRQVGPAGDPEDVLDALGLEAFPSTCRRLSSDWRCYQRAGAARARQRRRGYAWPAGDFAGFQRVLGIDRALDHVALVALDRVDASTRPAPRPAGSARGRGRAAWCGSRCSSAPPSRPAGSRSAGSRPRSRGARRPA